MSIIYLDIDKRQCIYQKIIPSLFNDRMIYNFLLFLLLQVIKIFLHELLLTGFAPISNRTAAFYCLYHSIANGAIILPSRGDDVHRSNRRHDRVRGLRQNYDHKPAWSHLQQSWFSSGYRM